MNWVGDALSTFGIGVLIGQHWACFELTRGWQTHDTTSSKKSIAWAETVAIILGLIVLSTLEHAAGK